MKVVAMVKASMKLLVCFYAHNNTAKAGFPSPADDFLDQPIDLNRQLIHNSAATFLVRVQGDSMKDAGILSGDVLIIDRSLKATHGKIVVAALNGEFTVKRLLKQGGTLQLMPENDSYLPVTITSHDEFEVWGVVTSVIHTF